MSREKLIKKTGPKKSHKKPSLFQPGKTWPRKSSWSIIHKTSIKKGSVAFEVVAVVLLKNGWQLSRVVIVLGGNVWVAIVRVVIARVVIVQVAIVVVPKKCI